MGVSYFCQKLSKWKGNYSRILTVSTDGVATYNPDLCTLTNSWTWEEVSDALPDTTKVNTFILEICDKKSILVDTLIVRSRSKSKSKLRFRTANISELLCEIRSHLRSPPSETTPYVFSGSLLLYPDIEKKCELLVENGYLLIRFFGNDPCVR